MNVSLHGYIAILSKPPLVLLYVSVCLSIQISKVLQLYVNSDIALNVIK